MANELLQQRQLVLREKRGFDVVENDGLIAVQILGIFGKALEEFFLILGTQTENDRLVILLGGGTKSRQQSDIEEALLRWADYKRRKAEKE